jgi:hypothetical protein
MVSHTGFLLLNAPLHQQQSSKRLRVLDTNWTNFLLCRMRDSSLEMSFITWCQFGASMMSYTHVSPLYSMFCRRLFIRNESPRMNEDKSMRTLSSFQVFSRLEVVFTSFPVMVVYLTFVSLCLRQTNVFPHRT